MPAVTGAHDVAGCLVSIDLIGVLIMTHIAYSFGMDIATFLAGMALLFYFYCLALGVAFFCQWLDKLSTRGWGASLRIIDEEREIKELAKVKGN